MSENYYVYTVALAQCEVRRGQTPGWVYFVSCTETGRVKIGYTKGDVAKRIKSLQTGAAGELVLLAKHPGTPETERSLHERFNTTRLHGEWFAMSDAIRDYLCVVVYAMGKIYRDAGQPYEAWLATGLHTLGTHAEKLSDEVLATIDMLEEA